MLSRERVLKSLRHEEPDRVPFDLAGSHMTGISSVACRNLREFLGLPPEDPVWADVIQQIVIPGRDVLEKLEVDTRGLYPLTSHNWNIYDKLEDGGGNWVYHDEWGMTQHFPKENGRWFSIVANPMAGDDFPPEAVEAHRWPDPRNPARIAGLREKAEAFRAEGKLVMIKGLCAGLFEMAQRIRGTENALMDPMVHPEASDLLLGRIADLKIAFWETALAELKDVVDVVVEGDDYGTQDAMFVSPDRFRAVYRPHMERLFRAIKKAAPKSFLFFHSCGSVRPIIPDFIEMGADILNPVHINAAGMEPAGLKKDFGNDIVFWGGGADTQRVLPSGSPEEIRDHVRRNLEALAPGGGYVFTPVHNIQPDVPARNVMAMWEALREFGRY